MFDGRTTAAWTAVAAALLAFTAVSETKWHAADPADDWRPCRATAAAGRRRHDETVKIDDEQDVNDGGGGDYARGDDDDDGGGGGGGEAAADDEFVEQEQPPPAPRPPVAVADDKPKRGVRVPPPPSRLYEKKWDRPPYPAVSGAANGLRMDTSLLRGETVELPTYVNVPVTLRCKFVPLDGTDNKFETVVEAMYPGHADSPPPPPDSHASQILKQLMGSVDGWRSVVNKSTRPVRRVVDNYYGRHYRHHHHHHNHRGWQAEEQPEVVEQIVPDRDDRRPVVDWVEHRSAEEPTLIENQLVDDDQRDDRVDGDQRDDRVDGDQRVDPVEGDQRVDPVEGDQRDNGADKQRLVDQVDDQLADRVDDDDRPVDRVAEEVDDRRVKGQGLDEELRTTMPEISTAVESDYAIFGQNVPVRTPVTGNAITTPSA